MYHLFLKEIVDGVSILIDLCDWQAAGCDTLARAFSMSMKTDIVEWIADCFVIHTMANENNWQALGQ